jgi:hypothetical protein
MTAERKSRIPEVLNKHERPSRLAPTPSSRPSLLPVTDSPSPVSACSPGTGLLIIVIERPCTGALHPHGRGGDNVHECPTA